MTPRRVVVVGGGLAGLRTVQQLRARQYRGRVTLLAAESRPPYDRPPLSKEALLAPLDGAEPDTTLPADFAALDVDLHLGEPAVGLAPGEGAGGVVSTTGGEYRFDALVVATGAAPVPVPGTGRQRFLRTHEDAVALRRLLGGPLLRHRTRLAIVGAGWIGAEVATAAAAHGCRVTVVEAAAAPLASAVGVAVGTRTAAWYEQAGVELMTSRSVGAVAEGGVAFADGTWLAADEVVTAVGVRPCVQWLAGSGVELVDGVATDERTRTSVPGVYAAGDCASLLSPRFGRRIRFEHWDVAMRAPEVVAANILGGEEVYDPVPYFWSEQFGRVVQYAGWHGVADRQLWRGDPDGKQWSVCWLRRERLVAVLTVDRPRDLVQGRRVIGAGGSVDAAALADPDVPVKAASR